MSPSFDFFGSRRNLLGESPLWDERTGSLYWVDSVGRQICRSGGDGVRVQIWEAPSSVGSIGLSESGLVAALDDGFYTLDLDSGAFSPVSLPERGNASVRFNDGKADRQGRFLAGTMRVGGASGAPAKLYRLERDGNATVLESGIQISNALCFSPSDDTLYFADSLQNCIWAYDYDGTLADRRVLIDTAPLGSVPDGATVDSEGCLWVALVQAQKLARFSPTGELLLQLDVPLPLPSCPAFGGPDLDTLYVTTISDSHGLLRSDHPDAGRILTITGLGVRGLPEARCVLDLMREAAA